MGKIQYFLLTFLVIGALAAPQRGNNRYNNQRNIGISNNRVRFSNQVFVQNDDDDSYEDSQIASTRFSNRQRFSSSRFSTDSDEYDQNSDERHLAFNGAGFSNQGSSRFPNRGSGFSNQGSGFSNQGSGFSNQGSGFSNQGSGFSNQDSGFSHNSGFSNIGSTFSNQGSGFSSPGSSFSHQGSDEDSFRFANQIDGFSSHDSGFSSEESYGPLITILRDDRESPLHGFYSFVFETSDGLRRSEQGSPDGPDGSVVQKGSWSFVYPDGTPAEFTFVADENGFQVESDLIPTPHPLPAHAIAQIEKAQRERAAGIFHDGSYRSEDYDEGRFDSFSGSDFRGNQGGSSFGGSHFDSNSGSSFFDDGSSFNGNSGSLFFKDDSSSSFNDNSISSFNVNSGSSGGNLGSLHRGSGFRSDNSASFGNSRSSSFGGNSGSFGGSSSFGVPLPTISGSSNDRRSSSRRQSNPRYGRSSNYYDFEDVLFESLKL